MPAQNSINGSTISKTLLVDGYQKLSYSDVTQSYLKQTIKKISKYGSMKETFTTKMRFSLQIGFYKLTGLGKKPKSDTYKLSLEPRAQKPRRSVDP